MMIDDVTLKQLLRINDKLLQLCKFLNEKRDMETSSRLIPVMNDLTHILIEARKNKLFLMRYFMPCECSSRRNLLCR